MLKSNYNVIALMSGTSLDGVDLIDVSFKFDGTWSFIINSVKTYDYDQNWVSTLKNLTKNSREDLSKIDKEYTNYLGEIINRFINEKPIKDIDFISSHGHTALHQPDDGYTYQIGNLPILADILQKTVICDFRTQDVNYGGQGAPLVPIGDKLLFNEYNYCLNLGGFANISYENNDSRVAYDICPANIVLNHYVSKIGLAYDDKGQLASQGEINVQLLTTLNNLKFYHQLPPKSLGLEWVETNIYPVIDSFQLKLEDVLRTFTEHVATQIGQIFLSKKNNVLITGGGAYNTFLVKRIEFHSSSKIIIPNKEIIEYKEALIFGLLGVLKYRNEINCLSSVTGAAKDHSSGKILKPKIKLK